MLTSSRGILVFIILIFLITGFVGSVAGFEVEGISYSLADTETAPGITTVIAWAWNAISFLFGIILMRVTGIPPFVSVFYVFLSLLATIEVVYIVRGN